MILKKTGKAQKNKNTWPEEPKSNFIIKIRCYDVFIWGYCESEEMLFHELEDLYLHVQHDLKYGSVI